MTLRSLRAVLLFALAISVFRVAQAVPSFSQDATIRFSSAAPQSIIATSTYSYRMYFIRDYTVRSATSTNLVDWVTLLTTNAPSDGQFSYSDYFTDLGVPHDPAPSSAYYRLHQP